MPLLSELRRRHPAGVRTARPAAEPRELPETSGLPVSILKEGVDRADREPDRPRGMASGYIHLTDLFDLCSRQAQLAQLNHTPVERTVTGGHRVMWAIGRAIEKHIRDSYIRNVDYEGVWGRWLCVCEHQMVEGLYQRDLPPCPRCRTKSNRYHELPLIDEEYGIIGSPDFVTLSPRGRLVVTEIKSITPNAWPELEEAKVIHKVQGAGYNKLYMRNGYEVEPYISVIYCNKLFRFGSPYKEYVSRVTDPVVAAELDAMWAVALQIKTGGEIDQLQPRHAGCTSHAASRAKKCPFVGECFMRSA